MTALFTATCQKIHNARHPEDLFNGVSDIASLKAQFHDLAAIIHPDQNLDRKDEATKAFQALNDLRERATLRIERGIFGNLRAFLNPITVSTKDVAYSLTSIEDSNELSTIYRGTGPTGNISLKLGAVIRDKDLFENEALNLRKIHVDAKDHKNQLALTLIPSLVDSFILTTGAKKQPVNVFMASESGMTLAELLKRFPRGIKLEHAAWMFNRIIGALEHPHNSGIVHGAIIPENIFVIPDKHVCILRNWEFSTSVGKPLKGTMGGSVRKYEYPPEVLKKEPVTLGLDLFMAATVFMHIVGGNPTTQEFPDWLALQDVPWTSKKTDAIRKIEGLIRACLLGKAKRISNAAHLFTDFRAALQDFFGPPTWHDFVIPNKQ